MIPWKVLKNIPSTDYDYYDKVIINYNNKSYQFKLIWNTSLHGAFSTHEFWSYYNEQEFNIDSKFVLVIKL